MRTILGVLLISAACVSTASAQRASSSSSFSMDHGHAADAAAAARASAAAAQAKAAAIAAGIPLTPSQQTNFSINGSGIIRATPVTPEEQKIDAEAQAAWQARCRPTTVEDHEGLRRTQYAEPNCDLSRFNTAGMP